MNGSHNDIPQDAFKCIPSAFQYYQNILLLSNSPEEMPHLQSFCPTCRVMLFPNNCFLSERPFHLRSRLQPSIVNATEPICLINAKLHAFKRHDLSVPIPNKIFVTYDRTFNTTSIEALQALQPLQLYENLHHKIVNKLMHSVDFGAMLSEEEGNCYASNEYLLSGLPVLSVRSRGGRDVFYDDKNSVQCEATLEGVREGYERMKELLKTVDRPAIRAQTIRRVLKFRAELVDVLLEWLQLKGQPVAASVVYDRLFRYNKGVDYINYCWNYKQVSSSAHRAPILTRELLMPRGHE